MVPYPIKTYGGNELRSYARIAPCYNRHHKTRECVELGYRQIKLLLMSPVVVDWRYAMSRVCTTIDPRPSGAMVLAGSGPCVYFVRIC